MCADHHSHAASDRYEAAVTLTVSWLASDETDAERQLDGIVDSLMRARLPQNTASGKPLRARVTYADAGDVDCMGPEVGPND